MFYICTITITFFSGIFATLILIIIIFILITWGIKINKNKDSIITYSIFLASITAFMGFGLVDPILPVISKQLGASPSQVNLLFSSYNGVMAIASIITRIFSKKNWHKKYIDYRNDFNCYFFCILWFNEWD